MNNSEHFTKMRNTESRDLSKIPILKNSVFFESIKSHCSKGLRVSSYFSFLNSKKQNQLIIVLADDESSYFLVSSTIIEGREFPSLAIELPQIQLFEREIAEQFGLIPEGHPRFYPVRFHHSYTESDAWNRNKKHSIKPSVIDFTDVIGNDIHEVAVGPVHAGVIEPGHFRFHCFGEKVFNLQISLGYQHRGIEKMLIGGPDKKTLHLIETVAGDSTIANTIAYSQIIESLSGYQGITLSSLLTRAILLELERMANHVGDIGALSNDVAFLPTSSYCGRIRGDFLNLTAEFCGNRFGRRAILPGGIAFQLDTELLSRFKQRFCKIFDEFKSAAELFFSSTSTMERLDGCGVLEKKIAKEIGVVGLVARATGIHCDSRFNFPSGIFNFTQIPIVFFDSGDVLARALVRYHEAINSGKFILEQSSNLFEENKASSLFLDYKLKPNSLSLSMVEAWRGETLHIAITDCKGRFIRYKIVDPSFHNWTALEVVLRNELIYNFPLCNKSFNLSYCGHDL